MATKKTSGCERVSETDRLCSISANVDVNERIDSVPIGSSGPPTAGVEAPGTIRPELLNSQHIFTCFMQHLTGLAWIKDLEGRYLYANDAALKAFGRASHELYGRVDDEVFPPETAAAFRSNDHCALSDGSGIRTVESLMHADGTNHLSFVAKFPIVDVQGRQVLVGGMAFDITERKQAENALQQVQQELDVVMNSMSASVTRCSRHMTYLWVNQHYADWLGRSPADFVGRPIADILGNDVYTQLHRHIGQVLSGETVSFDEEINVPGLGPRWVSATYSPTFDVSGAPDGWVAVITDITQRKLAQQAFHEIELRKVAILDACPDAIISIDRHGRILEWNPSAERMFGIGRHEAIGQEISQIVIPERFRARHRAGFARYLATGEGSLLNRRVDLVARGVDGAEFPVELTVTRIAGSGGPVFTGFVHDVTDRNRADRQLKKLNARLKRLLAERTQNTNRLLEEAPDGIVVIDEDGQIVRANLQAESIFGYGHDELIGQTVEMLLPEPVRAQHVKHRTAFFAAPHLRAMGSGLELFGLHKDGHPVAVEIQLTPLVLDGDRVAVASIRDVTARRLARDVERRLAAVMQSTMAAIIILDIDGNVRHWNRGAELLYGYSASEIIGKDVRRLIPPTKLGEFVQLLQTAKNGTVIGEHETVRLRKDGSLIDVALTVSLMDDGEGPLEICKVSRDIRERKRLEQQVAELADAERQRIGRDLHDTLGQECTAIGMLVATLKKSINGPEMLVDIVSRLESGVERAKHQLSVLSKGLFPVDVDADGLQVALEDLAEDTSRNLGVSCSIECHGRFPLHDHFVATQLYLLAREAVHNAVKHAGASHIVIEIEDHGGFRLSVCDDGRGISPVTQASSGMGMDIMRHRASLIGGSLQVRPDSDGGTIVSCTLHGRA